MENFDFLTKTFDGFFGYFLAAIIGFFSRAVFLRIPRFFRYVSRKAHVRWKETYFPDDTDTITLDLAGTNLDDDAGSGFIYDYKSIRDSAQVFRLSFPVSVVSGEDIGSTSFSLKDFNTKSDEVFGKNHISHLEEITGIEGLSEKIVRASEIEAKLFFSKKNGRHFNGKAFGLRSVNFNRSGNLEQPKIDISLYRTDYFTQCVMHRVALDLLSDGTLSPDEISSNRNSGFDVINSTYYPFIAGLAINAFVLTDEGREIVLVRRSANANNSLDHAGKYNTSIDEAFSQFDTTHSKFGHGNVTIQNCFRRGAKEELGINLDDPMLGELSVYQVFFVKSLFQVALAGHCTFDGTFEELRSLPAQDKPLEHESMESFEFRVRPMSKLVNSGELIPFARDLLIDLCRIRGIDVDSTLGKGISPLFMYIKIYVGTFVKTLTSRMGQ
ncbi:hypothetical protein [Pseudophaeobacter sp. EL27]|uniref:hypothetical protein n=1 Tax=Pseudophaeobacter sp. EL27 TaxID=2107580 RepID=UPI0013C4C0BB|nr:hypothetical protein [Pseudophaeobacter sp. EL27]